MTLRKMSVKNLMLLAAVVHASDIVMTHIGLSYYGGQEGNNVAIYLMHTLGHWPGLIALKAIALGFTWILITWEPSRRGYWISLYITLLLGTLPWIIWIALI